MSKGADMFKRTHTGWRITLPGLTITQSLKEHEVIVFGKVAVGYHRLYDTPTLYAMLVK